MSSFILRILFSGLIVFVPSQDRQQLTVLLLNVAHPHHLSDGSSVQKHKPLLLARAGSCSGDCETDNATIAQYLFRDQSSTAAVASLEAAVTGGGAWQLGGSELSIEKGSSSDPELPSLTFADTRPVVNGVPAIIPTTSSEREDFSWVADLNRLCGECEVDSSMHATTPPAIVAARLKLRTGNVFTYSVARIGGDVTPVHFGRLDGTGSASDYTQAIATWVGADVEISGDSVEIVESKFDNSGTRTMTLSPDMNGHVELALLNLPPFVPPASPYNDAPQVGKHFEMYYDVLDTPPDAETRLVPKPGAAAGAPSFSQVDWHDIHPSTALWSDLLNAVRLNIGRTAYDRLLCPPTQGVP